MPRNDFQNNNQPIKSNPYNQLSTIQVILKVSAIIFDASCAYQVQGFWKSLLPPLPLKKVSLWLKKLHVTFFMLANMVIIMMKGSFHHLQVM